MRKSYMLAAAAMAMMAATPAAAADIGYPIQSRFLPSTRSSGQRPKNAADKARIRAKMAAKSKRQQRRKG